MNEEIKILIPEGFDGIDMEKSDFVKGIIVFKKKEDIPWVKRKPKPKLSGFFIDSFAVIQPLVNAAWSSGNLNTFVTEKQAQSSLAMAQLSQIMQHDERFGGPITDEEWDNPNICKYVIFRQGDEIKTDYWNRYYHFLAFHTKEQRNLFMQENMDLIKQYFMLD